MNTLSTLLISTAITTTIFSNAQTALDANGATRNVKQENSARYDLVESDMRTVTHDPAKAFQRVSTFLDGSYHVRIISVEGQLRMTGSFLDPGLTLAHGEFHYYNANGNLESTGMYVNGNKKGMWSRYDIDGRALAERNYGASNYEDLALELGWTTKAGAR